MFAESWVYPASCVHVPPEKTSPVIDSTSSSLPVVEYDEVATDVIKKAVPFAFTSFDTVPVIGKSHTIIPPMAVPEKVTVITFEELAALEAKME